MGCNLYYWQGICHESRVYKTWLGLDGPMQYKVWRLSPQNYMRWFWQPNCGRKAIVNSYRWKRNFMDSTKAIVNSYRSKRNFMDL